MSNLKLTYISKCIIIGDTLTGKTSVTNSYIDNKFNYQFSPTIGVDFRVKNMEYDDKIIKLHLWDTAGQERFKSIITSYFKGVTVAILVYDITDKKSYDNMKYWIKELEKEEMPKLFYIVGNKIDLKADREVSIEEGKEFADNYDAHFFEVSAKTGINIQLLFNDIFKKLCNIIENGDKTNYKIRLQNNKIINKPEKKCCIIL